MTSPVLTENPHALCFVVSEVEPGFYTRDTGKLATGLSVLPGAVLARLAADSTLVIYDPAGSGGAATPVGIAGYAVSSVGASAPVPVLLWDGPGEVRAADLIWKAGLSNNDIATGLQALRTIGIKAR